VTRPDRITSAYIRSEFTVSDQLYAPSAFATSDRPLVFAPPALWQSKSFRLKRQPTTKTPRSALGIAGSTLTGVSSKRSLASLTRSAVTRSWNTAEEMTDDGDVRGRAATSAVVVVVVAMILGAACSSSSKTTTPPSAVSRTRLGEPTTVSSSLQEVTSTTTDPIAKAVSDYAKGDDSLAKSEFQALLEAHPANKIAWYDLGTIAGMAKKSEEAEADYAKALSLDPRFEVALYSEGEVRFAAGDMTGAASYLTRALAVNPNDGIARRLLARVSARAKRT
jgi:Tetratricopeptide repeat